MKFVINSTQVIFTQISNDAWGFSSQNHNITSFKKVDNKCVRKKNLSNLDLSKNIIYPLSIKYKNNVFTSNQLIIKRNIIVFVLDQKPNEDLYTPFQNVSYHVINSKNEKQVNKKIFIPLQIPITNIEGNYVIPVYFGSNNQLANLVVDTGSSNTYPQYSNFGDLTYNPVTSKTFTPTNNLFYINYESGCSGGTIVNDIIMLMQPARKGYPSYNNSFNAQIGVGCYAENHFSPLCKAGILGLGFTSDNNIYQGDSREDSTKNVLAKYTYNASQNIICSQEIDNYWENVQNYYNKNGKTFMDYIGLNYSIHNQKFALWIPRAVKGIDTNNNGYFYLGCGEEYTDNYEGKLLTIPIVKTIDFGPLWYSPYVGSITWTYKNKILVVNIPNQPKKYNQLSFIDSGTTKCIINLSKNDYLCVLNYYVSNNFDGLVSTEKDFKKLFNNQGKIVPLSNINPSNWPTISIMMYDGNKNPQNFNIKTTSCWEIYNHSINSYNNLVSYKNIGENQTFALLGLPFLTSNFCVFDYGNLLVKLAPISSNPTS